jgi:hypothetical protein
MFTLKIDDGICKGFKNEEDVDFFINKAYDEETDKHALLIYIPKIPAYNILHVQQPLFYDNEAERDRIYSDNMDDEFVNAWWGTLINQIEEQRKNQENGTETSEG